MNALPFRRPATAQRATFNRRGFCALSLACAARASGARTASDVQTVPLWVSEAVDAVSVKALLDLLAVDGAFRWDLNVAPFARVLRMVELGKAVGFGISPTPQRAATLQFSAPVFRGAVWVVNRRGSGVNARRPADLHGRTVCASRAADYGDTLLLPEAGDLHRDQVAGSLSERVRLLLAGRCDDLLVTSRSVSADTVHERLRRINADLPSLEVSAHPLVEQDVHFAAAKGADVAQWLPRLDDAIHARRKDIQRWVDRGE